MLNLWIKFQEDAFFLVATRSHYCFTSQVFTWLQNAYNLLATRNMAKITLARQPLYTEIAHLVQIHSEYSFFLFPIVCANLWATKAKNTLS